MLNKTDYRKVTVCQNDLYTVGLVTGFDDDVRSNVQYFNTTFIHIVQISSLASACIDQPLLTFWSQIEQSWMFVLITAA